ncbi:MAG: DUF493 domain-containing protein [Gammaproteobacteria bacterium]|nr:DUF493 domain-containing protein [Gammaproteobacteria bacterium]
MTDEVETLLEFPCSFPIKAFGKTGETLEIAVLEIVNQHVDDLAEGAVKMNASKNAKFTSITITINATSKQQIDNIYLDLTACEHVVMAL